MQLNVVRNWHTSTYSVNNDSCVEVGRVVDGAAVRDTKNRTAGFFVANSDQWSMFVAAIKSGRYDQ